ncbi:MAG: hypothetical protein LBO72_10760, partial [Helicobacteraceae bacterium]|nr:hypothetical protein [Helicobacteraceae bacterium]
MSSLNLAAIVAVSAVVLAVVIGCAYGRKNAAANAQTSANAAASAQLFATAVSSGNRFSLALSSDGNVYARGSNYFGQLGVGDNIARDDFTLVPSLAGKNITAIAIGDLHALALDKDGNVYGSGASDAIIGDSKTRQTFTLIPSLKGKKIVAIAASGYHSLALASDGVVYASGNNDFGQLGVGEERFSFRVFTPARSLEGKKIVAIAAGYMHSFAIDDEGKLYAAGDDGVGDHGFGQIGLGGESYGYHVSFELIETLAGKKIAAISTNYAHSLALTSDGNVYATGMNENGQLGFGDKKARVVFTLVTSLSDKKIAAISAGFGHSLALDSDGNVYGAGAGYGIAGDAKARQTFAPIPSLQDKKIKTIEAGGDLSYAIDFSGAIYATIDAADSTVFAPVFVLERQNVAVTAPDRPIAAPNDRVAQPFAATSNFHTLALTKNGKLYAAGKNNRGQLGLGDTSDRYFFTHISDLDDKTIVALAADGEHSMALDAEGKLYAAGNNGNGQLGLGDRDNRENFTLVSSLKGKKIVAVSVGDYYSLALDAEGKVYAAGANDRGQLGLGDRKNRENFTLVKSLRGAKIAAIATGGSCSFAIDFSGKVYAAGDNEFGQLGLGTSGKENDRESFTLVKSLEGKKIAQVTASYAHALALDIDGKVYGAGGNGSYQLGLDDVDISETFTPIASLSGKKIARVAAGTYHSLAL